MVLQNSEEKKLTAIILMSTVMPSWMLRWGKEEFGHLKINLREPKDILEKIGLIRMSLQL